jgi:hypothetical protein
MRNGCCVGEHKLDQRQISMTIGQPRILRKDMIYVGSVPLDNVPSLYSYRKEYRLAMERERTEKSRTEKLSSFIENDAKIQK